MDNLDSVRSHVIRALQGGQAYGTFDDVVSEFTFAQAGTVPDKAEHSAWQIVSHIVFAQCDILDYCRNEDGTYVEKSWPEDYWPKSAGPADEAEWHGIAKAYHSDLHELEALVADDGRDLFAAFPWGDGQSLLREALMVVEHTGYHLGQLVVVRRLLA